MALSRLDKADFDTFARQIKRADAVYVAQLKVMATEAMQRLRLRTRLRKAVAGMPEGSDQLNSGAFQDWLNRVTREDAEACSQVQALHATILSRLGG